jgi:hypothetical protein
MTEERWLSGIVSKLYSEGKGLNLKRSDGILYFSGFPQSFEGNAGVVD